MKRASVTLKSSLSLAVGRYRFIKDRPVIVDDKELLQYCIARQMDFSVKEIKVEGAAPKKAAAPAKKPVAVKPTPKVEKKPEPVKVDEPKKAEPVKVEPVSPQPGLKRKQNGDNA